MHDEIMFLYVKPFSFVFDELMFSSLFYASAICNHCPTYTGINRENEPQGKKIVKNKGSGELC